VDESGGLGSGRGGGGNAAGGGQGGTLSVTGGAAGMGGGAGSAGEEGCPDTAPSGACLGPAHPCHYDYNGCSCLETETGCQARPEVTCPLLRAEPPPSGSGGACDGPDCPQAILVPAGSTCTCEQNEWSCVHGILGGPP
ncbi:MAG TPA: hypothetical protein VGQ57_01865, partial [Polyangiaceae bacterium]|nr:hypothetical protein [Polyangiaceae bacterium]